jgi:AhpD family alkylhydroperoxidase
MTERITLQDVPKGFADGLMKSEMYLKKSSLDHKTLELVKYRVSQINGCAFCLDMHHKEAIALGETEQRLHSIAAWRECPYYNEKEKAALAFAEALTHISGRDIDDALYQSLTNVFSKEEIADLTLGIAQINSWNRINRAFHTVPGNYKVGQYN